MQRLYQTRIELDPTRAGVDSLLGGQRRKTKNNEHTTRKAGRPQITRTHCHKLVLKYLNVYK